MGVKVHIVLEDDGATHSIGVSGKALATIAAALPDSHDASIAFDSLSRHADSEVRAAVATKKHLSEQAVKRLANDPALAVLKVLLKSGTACRLLGCAEVLPLCRRDPALAEMVANAYEEFVLCDDAVIEYLEKHPDSRVRESLAGNPFVPKHVLHRLADLDGDDRVRELAREIASI